jgi:NAD(P)-dependent dehydrogenase (short-subunit alcohol dehydrogenase family)
VLVLGASTGIGHAIARNFCAAGASRVVILARRREVLEEAAAKLRGAYPNTDVVPRVGGFLSLADVTSLWDGLAAEGVQVDVLVLSATGQPAQQPVLEQGVARAWEDFEANVHAPMAMVDRFYHQPPGGHEGRKKYCIFVSSQLIHNLAAGARQPVYGVTKAAMTAVMGAVARDTPPGKMQVVSFHPGAVFTEAAANQGYTETSIPWFHGTRRFAPPTPRFELLSRY